MHFNLNYKCSNCSKTFKSNQKRNIHYSQEKLEFQEKKLITEIVEEFTTSTDNCQSTASSFSESYNDFIQTRAKSYSCKECQMFFFLKFICFGLMEEKLIQNVIIVKLVSSVSFQSLKNHMKKKHNSEQVNFIRFGNDN